MSILSKLASRPTPPPELQRKLANVHVHMWQCGMIIFMQAWLDVSGRVSHQLGSSTWWALLPGVALGVLVWLPVHALSTAGGDDGLIGGLKLALGKIHVVLCAWYALVLLINASMALFALIMLTKAFLLADTNVEGIGLLAVLCMTISKQGRGLQNSSMAAYGGRHLYVMGIALTILVFIGEADTSNLFPILGPGVMESLGAGALTGGAFSSIFLLGLAPAVMLGHPHPSKKQGLLTLLVAGAAIMALQFSATLIQPYAIMMAPRPWSTRLLAASDAIERWALFRFVFMMLQFVGLLVTMDGAICFSTHSLSKVCPSLPLAIPLGVLCLALCAVPFLYSSSLAIFYTHWMPLRLPVIALPLWSAYGVLRLRRRKEPPCAPAA